MKKSIFSCLVGMLLLSEVAWAENVASLADTDELRQQLVERDKSAETDGVVFGKMEMVIRAVID